MTRSARLLSCRSSAAPARGARSFLVARRALAALLVSSGATALGVATAPAQAAAPPTEVTIRDGRTSPASVDISSVRLTASAYYYSTQAIYVTVPGGFQPGHRLTVWFDLDHDNVPDGHITTRFGAPRGGELPTTSVFRVGGGWGQSGTVRDCLSGDDHVPVAPPRPGESEVTVGVDVWHCLGAQPPRGTGVRGTWRASVQVYQDGLSDMAPSGRAWSPAVAGWTSRDG